MPDEWLLMIGPVQPGLVNRRRRLIVIAVGGMAREVVVIGGREIWLAVAGRRNEGGGQGLEAVGGGRLELVRAPRELHHLEGVPGLVREDGGAAARPLVHGGQAGGEEGDQLARQAQLRPHANRDPAQLGKGLSSLSQGGDGAEGLDAP